jgi:hypothetical protein
MWNEFIIGSNVFQDTPGVLVVEGQEQIWLERGSRDDQLLLTMDVYDGNGIHVAKLRRNAWAFNEGGRHDITTNPKSLQLIDKEADSIVVEAQVLDRDRVQVPRGAFYTVSGVRIIITSEYLQLGTNTLSNCRFENCQRGIALGGGAMGIGSA